MARQLRLQLEGAFYHVMARGNEKRAIFFGEEDFCMFLRILAGAVTRFDFEVHAYCLMPNHYHLLLRTRRPNLSAGMQFIGACYAQTLNQDRNRVGHLFQGRFKALLVDRDSYFLRLSRYIHLNPVRAGLCARPEEFRWSSCRAFLGLEAPSPWLSIDQTRALLGGTQTEFPQRYKAIIEDTTEDHPLDEALGQLLLGSENFNDALRERARALSGTDPELQCRTAWPRRPPIASVLQAVAREFGSAEGKPWGRSMGRLVTIHLLRDKFHYPLADIARWAGMGPSAISHAAASARRRLEADPNLAGRMDRLRSHLEI